MKKRTFRILVITILFTLTEPAAVSGLSSIAKITTDTTFTGNTMGEFIGTNSFIDVPLDKLAPVGWIREYHPWSFNEIEKDIYEYNRWNGFWDFDQFYTDLKQQGTMVCPVLWGSPSWLQPNHNDRPVVGSEDPFTPYSYREIAEMMYQFAGRYGSVEVDKSNLIVNSGQTVKSGLNLISFIEDWNEQDKNWEGETAEFKPGHYAAMASANVDGHGGTMGPLYGMKQADPGLKFVMGGLVELDTSYLKGMHEWFIENRPDSSWPIDVINVHHYSFIRDNTGISPEADFFKQKLENVVKWRNQNVPECEVWLTEFGYDSNPYSMNRAPEIGNFSQEEVQAIWNLRAFLIASSTGIERAAHYMARDTDPGTEYRYGDSGLLTSKAEGHEPKVSWYYLHTMYTLLKNMYFSKVIVEDSNTWLYKYESIKRDTAIYVGWSPTSTDSKSSYLFKTDLRTDSVKITSLIDKSIIGESTVHGYDTSGIEVIFSESPLFIEVIRDTSAITTDTTTIVTDTTALPLFRLHSGEGLSIYPNPVCSLLNIKFEKRVDMEQTLEITILNACGTRISKERKNIAAGDAMTQICADAFPEGIYLVNILGENFSYSQPFIRRD